MCHPRGSNVPVELPERYDAVRDALHRGLDARAGRHATLSTRFAESAVRAALWCSPPSSPARWRSPRGGGRARRGAAPARAQDARLRGEGARVGCTGAGRGSYVATLRSVREPLTACLGDVVDRGLRLGDFHRTDWGNGEVDEACAISNDLSKVDLHVVKCLDSVARLLASGRRRRSAPRLDVRHAEVVTHTDCRRRRRHRREAGRRSPCRAASIDELGPPVLRRAVRRRIVGDSGLCLAEPDRDEPLAVDASADERLRYGERFSEGFLVVVLVLPLSLWAAPCSVEMYDFASRYAVRARAPHRTT